jgi:hypothetical protein
MSNLSNRIVPPAALALLVLSLFWRPIVTGGIFAGTDLLQVISIHRVAPPEYQPRNILQSDTVLLFLPTHRWTRYRLSEGEIPLWNPRNGTGAPHLGNYESAIFSPYTAPYYFLPFRLAILLAGFAKLFSLGLFTYLYLRAVGATRDAALFGGTAFAFSGYHIVWLNYTASGAAISLPAALYFVERCVAAAGSRRDLIGNAAGVSLALAAGLFTGHPETFFFCALLVGAYSLARIAESGRQAALRLVVVLGAAAVVAAAVAAVQLLPFFEYMRESSIFSVRGSHAPVAFRSGRDFILQVLPNLLGSPVEAYYDRAIPGHYPGTAGAFVPLVALVLAPFSLRSPRRTTAIFFLGAALFWCAYYYNVAGMGTALRVLPLMGVAAPFSSQPVWLFSVCCSATLGLDALLRSPTRKARVGFICSAALMIAGAFVLQHWYRMRMATAPGNSVTAPWAREQVAGHIAVLLLATAGGVALVLAAARYGGWRGQLSLAALTLLTFIQSFASFSEYTPTVDRKYFYPVTPSFQRLVTAARGQLTLRLDGTALPPNSSLWYGVDGVANYDGMGVRHYDRLYSQLIRSDHRTTEFEARPVGLHALQLMGIRYVSTTRAAPFPGAESLEGAGEFGPYRLLRVPAALDRYTVVPAHVETTEDRALEAMRQGSFDPRAVVLLIGGKKSDPGESISMGARVAPAARVSLLREEPEEIDLVAHTSRPGWLLALRSHFPGWEARVNGAPVEVRRANVAYMASPVGSGTNRIELRYEPASFRVGSTISLIALTVLLMSVVYAMTGGSSRQRTTT